MFKSELIREAKTVGNLKEKAIKVTRTDGKMISPADAKEFVNSLQKGSEKKFKEYKMMVKGVGIDGMWTMKTFKEDELNYKDLEEYHNGKVASTAKFLDLYQMQIFISYALK